MPPKPRQLPNSSRRASDSSNYQSDHSSANGLDLRTCLEEFLAEAVDARTSTKRKKKIRRLMQRISSILPKSALDQKDRDLCLDAIRVYIKHQNPKALGFLSLIEEKSYDYLRLCVRCFSELTMKDKIMSPETLTVHDPCDAGTFISQLKSITTIRPLKFPTPENYDVIKRLMNTFNIFFDQSSEQSAVIKVAAYSVLLHLQNEHLCTKYFPEFGLFSITPKESAAEVVARVNSNDYRYFLTGRADGFIVSLTAQTETGLSILADNEVQRDFRENLPKYQPLASRLQELVDRLNSEYEDKHFSYEIVILEAKKLQPPANIRGMELRNHLKQVIGECAAIHEYGPDQCRFLKFILSDGDRWLFGVLQNPETNAVGSNTQRECFYASLDNTNLGLVEQITELLAVWMAIPGNMLYDSFLRVTKEVAVVPGA